MATEVLLVKTRDGLKASDPISQESIDAIAIGKQVSATLRLARNVKHHRKFFAMLGVIYENQTRYPTSSHLLAVIKILTGHYDVFPVRGKETFFVKSINFAAMDQIEFESFYNHAVNIILQEIIPGLDKQDLENRVLEILGDGLISKQNKQASESEVL